MDKSGSSPSLYEETRTNGELNEKVKVDVPRPQSAPAIVDKRDTSTIDIMFRFQKQMNYYFIKAFNMGITVAEVKKKLADSVKLSHKQLNILLNRAVLPDYFVLSDIPIPEELSYVEVFLGTLSGKSIDTSGIENLRTMRASVVPKVKLEKVTIKFFACKQNRVFTRAYYSSMTVKEVIEDLCLLLALKFDNVVLTRNKRRLNDRLYVKDLDYDSFGNADVNLTTLDDSYINLDVVYKDVPIHDILTVTVPYGRNSFKILTVEVTNAAIKKPYLGGYRNVKTGLEYHHAYSQTQPKREKLSTLQKTSRDTQTAEAKEKIYDTMYSRATQMASKDIYIPCITDIIMEPKKYETYEEMVARLRHGHYASIIQRAYRAYRYRKLINSWLQECKRLKETMEDEKLADFIAREKRIKKEAVSKTFPRSRDDFDQLYSMVDRWRNSEIARISALHAKGPKIAEFTLLLDKEVELLRAIERYRIQLKEDMKAIKNKRFLEEISKPVTWSGPNGQIICMDTMESQRARKLKELYLSFCRTDLSVEERMELIVNLKYALKDFRFPMTTELMELLDRECDLTVRNYSSKDLEYLRKRIQATILRFIQQSELNSGATRRRNIKNKREMVGNLYYCETCGKCKLQSDFPLNSRMRLIQVCSSCSWTNTESATWTDMTPYKFIMDSVRKDERRKKAWGSLAFVMQDDDVHFLVDKIWHCHSVLSEGAEIFDLRLVRWYKDEDWSPWNCVLLHIDEIEPHIKLKNPDEVYDLDVVKKVKARHISAKTHFHQLMNVDKHFTEGGYWHAIRANAVDHAGGVHPL